MITVLTDVEKEEQARTAEAAVKEAFGISIAEFVRFHKEANEMCPLCMETKDINDMLIDLFPLMVHKIRGIICVDCKKVITAINDNWNIIERLTPYMRGDFRK